MKRLFRLLLVLITVMMFVGFGCQSDSSLPDNEVIPSNGDRSSYTLDTPMYRGTFLGYKPLDYQKTTPENADTKVGEHIPLPTCLPEGFSIQEVYIAEDPQGYRWIVHFLISDEPIEWQDGQFYTRILYTLYWVSVEPKRPDLDTVSISQGRGWAYIEEEDDSLRLFWYIRGSLRELRAAKQCPLEGLAKIAGAVQ